MNGCQLMIWSYSELLLSRLLIVSLSVKARRGAFCNTPRRASSEFSDVPVDLHFVANQLAQSIADVHANHAVIDCTGLGTQTAIGIDPAIIGLGEANEAGQIEVREAVAV